MEAFHLLSRGGATFDKQRFKSDVKLFSVCFYSHNRLLVLKYSRDRRMKKPRARVLRRVNSPMNWTSSSTRLLGLRNANPRQRVTQRRRDTRGKIASTMVEIPTPRIRMMVPATLAQSRVLPPQCLDTESPRRGGTFQNV